MIKLKLVILMNQMTLGGTEKSLINFLKFLDKETFDITVLLLEEKGTLLKEIPAHVRVKSIEGASFAKGVLAKNPIQNIIFNLNSLRLIEAFKILYTYMFIRLYNQWYRMIVYAAHKINHQDSYDICLSYPGPHTLMSYIALEKIKANKKIQFIHSDVRKTFDDLGFGDKFYPKFDKIICVSDDSAKHFKDKYPKCDKVEVFNNIIDIQEIQTLAYIGPTFTHDTSNYKILTIARLSIEKGVRLIPEIVERLLTSNIDNFIWYIMGDGPEKDHLSQIILDKGYAKYIQLLGSIKNPYPYLKDCDIYVQPSLFEGFGISVAEAKVFNKPMVITNFSNAKKLITNNETGFITDITANHISQHLIKLLSNKSLQEKFRSNLFYENQKLNQSNYKNVISDLILN